MGLETERKFLVAGDSWRDSATEWRTLCQGYLAIDGGTTVRVRTDGQRAWVTIKGAQEGLSRPEFEYEVPADEAGQLLGLCRGRLVEKVRHKVPVGPHVWEVDEFGGANRGLIVSELELSRPDEDFMRPAWLGREVSDDPRYLNASLSVRPYGEWAGRRA
ncbi:MAG: CYTH domain-containing protein [Chthoniobacterales bacterium]|nr:CYTH domain-containing protein [Chthoniobacterales bacterium]